MSEKVRSYDKQNNSHDLQRSKGTTVCIFRKFCILHDEDFALLFDLNTSKNCDFHYWEYDSFDLDPISEDDAYTEFRFLKNCINPLQPGVAFYTP